MESPARLTHLSVQEGCGGTTWGIQFARDVINLDDKVLWCAEKMPDPARFSQMMQNLTLASSSNFLALPIEEDWVKSIERAGKIAESLESIRLVVIDDWTPPLGRVDDARFKAVKLLVEGLKERNQNLLLISAAYEDASRSSAIHLLSEGPISVGWYLKARGVNQLNEIGFKTEWLVREGQGPKRIHWTENNRTAYRLVDAGFVLTAEN